ncbi:multidrug effflux MFS transporter [Siccirubricoccus phaeus]|uniref:multidrug effflux MFS transporter n=1 Tax=Siccirubricoccus phaeus TaxID=2595053 RepID=UPI0011F300F4
MIPETLAGPPARPKPAIALLVAMTAIGPFTMQILVPTMPALAVALGTSYGTVQFVLTGYLLGMGLGQMIYGPLSDRYGRKPLLLGGLGLFLLGTVLAAAAPSAPLLIAARVLQAVGGCAGMVLGRAMVRDAYPREEAASVIGVVSSAMAVAPMISPLLGSFLEQWFGWRANMLVCLLFALPLLAAVQQRLGETLAMPVPLPGLAGLLGAYAQLVRLPAFRAYCGITTWSNSVFFAFAVGAPLVVISGMGYPAPVYAGAQMLIAVAWSAGTFTASRLVRRFGTLPMLRLGSAITLGGGALALLVVALLPPHLLLFFAPMAVVAYGNGVTQPPAIAAAVSVRPQLAGTASGLLGALQMGFGALMSVLAGLTESGSGIATAIWMLVGGLGAQFCLWQARRAGAA